MSARIRKRIATTRSRRRPVNNSLPPADPNPYLPEEYVASLKVEGERGAARVAEFLRRFGISGTSTSPVALPAELLLGLNVALRFRAWELSSITAHLEAGLPSSNQVVERVMSLLQGDELREYVEDLDLRAIFILREQFVWQASGEQSADIAIVTDGNEDAFLDALADFLWANRHNLTTSKEATQ